MEELAYMWRPALPISTSMAVVRIRTVSTSDAHRTGPGKGAAMFKCLLHLIAWACIQHSCSKTSVFNEGSVHEHKSTWGLIDDVLRQSVGTEKSWEMYYLWVCPGDRCTLEEEITSEEENTFSACPCLPNPVWFYPLTCPLSSKVLECGIKYLPIPCRFAMTSLHYCRLSEIPLQRTMIFGYCSVSQTCSSPSAPLHSLWKNH